MSETTDTEDNEPIEPDEGMLGDYEVHTVDPILWFIFFVLGYVAKYLNLGM